ncbi:MAG: B12-binding domain-containing radical SAM protein [Clostridiales bacterium]|jgi:radical SAM superfamily enzyme YgiQ (UPF0313 family)|nr:B12-binding domain-containing radical SAM protein [Clostridiales bacterium]
MLILLAAINAKYIHSCLALHCLAAFRPDLKESVKIREFTINQEKEYLLREIYALHPDIACFSCYIWNIEKTISLVRTLKQVMPDIKIILGGPEVSFESQSLFEYPVDVVVRGEGEKPFSELMDFYLAGVGSLSAINGITYRKGGAVFENPDSQSLDLTYSKFAYHYSQLSEFTNRIVYYESSRGCPFRCSYCLSGYGGDLRSIPLERVERELAFFLKSNVPQVKFVDRTFNAVKRRSQAIWKLLIDNDNGFSNFHFEIAGDLLDEQDFHILERARPGLFQFEIGVQTSNEKTLASLQRKTDLESLSRNALKLRSMGNIHIHLDLIAGLPGETLSDVKNSINFVHELSPEQFQLGFLKLLKGTSLRMHALVEGLHYDESPPYEILRTKDMPFSEMLKLKGIESALSMLLNSGMFVQTLKYSIPLFPSAFDFYESFSSYWIERNLHASSHTKMKIYEILFEFLSGPAAIEELKDVMKFDLLANDLSCTPPAWLTPPKTSREKKLCSSFLDNYCQELCNRQLEPLSSIERSKAYAKLRRKLAISSAIESFSIDMPLFLSCGRLKRRSCELLILRFNRLLPAAWEEVKCLKADDGAAKG